MHLYSIYMRKIKCYMVLVDLLMERKVNADALAVVVLMLLIIAGCREAGSHRGPIPEAVKICAVTLDARTDPGVGTIERIRDLGATHITLISFGFQPDSGTPEIRFSPEVRWYSESASGARRIAQIADSLGLRIILKPQLWLRGGAWTADIDFASEEDWTQWEGEYRDFALYAALLAQEIDAEMLVIGTELSNPVRKRPHYWRSLIGEIRTLFGGRLTYAANWHDDYQHVEFWDALDYIGVQAYFPISSDDGPDIENLLHGWSRHKQDLLRLHLRFERPILFTEIGYRSVAYAASEPWRWPSREEHGLINADPELQARLYESFFRTLWFEDWFAGAIVWKWYPEARSGPRIDIDFTPQQKPAEDVIRAWFSR